VFSIEEATAWTAEEAVARLKLVLPKNLVYEYSLEEGWHRITLIAEEGEVVWSGEQADLKILALDALGWLRVRDHQTENPIWKPRAREVSLYRPPVSESEPDPPDLDPEEVEAVYKASLNKK